MSRPHLLKDTVIYALTNIATKVIGALLLPIITRLISPSMYGAVDVITLFGLVMLELIICGLDFVVALYFHDDSSEQQRLISTMIVIRIGLGCLIAALLTISAPILIKLLLGTPPFDVLTGYTIAMWTLPWSGVISLGFMLLRQTGRSVALLVSTIGRVVLTSSLTGLFVWQFNDAVAGYFWAALATDLLIASAILGLFKPRFAAVSWQLARTLLQKGIGFLPRSIYFVLMTLITRQILLHFGSLNDVGLYAAAVKISFIVWIGVSASSQAWLSYSMAIAKHQDAHTQYRYYLLNYVIWMGWLIVAVSLFAPELLRVLTTEVYIQAAPAVGWLAVSLGVIGSLVIVSTGLNIIKETAAIGKTTLFAALLNVLIAFVCIPRFGMVGAAFAAASDQLVAAIILYRIAQRRYPLPFDIRAISCWLSVILILVGIATQLPSAWNSAVFAAKGAIVLAYGLAIIRWGNGRSALSLMRSYISKLQPSAS